MTFEELSVEDQQVIQNALLLARPMAGELARVITRMKISMAGTGASDVVTKVTSLAAGSKIPNATGLAGARALTREQVLTLFVAASAFIEAATPAVMAACVDAAGPQNCMG